MSLVSLNDAPVKPQLLQHTEKSMNRNIGPHDYSTNPQENLKKNKRDKKKTFFF